ncbi:MAG: ribosome assembly cofactor RimP [Sphaerochaetaceae bacterium]|nr:ribosome assembly cofactor RimP [Sphaerochaetaceae bacterium]
MKKCITLDPLFEEFSPLLDAMNVVLVDIESQETPYECKISCIVKLKEGEVGVDETAKVFRLIRTRMELRLAPETDLNLEVSTPGLQRKIRDAYEFTLFKGKRVRVYDLLLGAWVSGIIENVDDESLVLTSCLDADNKSIDKNLVLKFETIQKAKLEYIWEEKKHAK